MDGQDKESDIQLTNEMQLRLASRLEIPLELFIKEYSYTFRLLLEANNTLRELGQWYSLEEYEENLFSIFKVLRTKHEVKEHIHGILFN